MDNTNDKNQQTIVVVNSNTPVLGILSLVFSIIAIFVFAIVFAPLGLIFGIIAMFKKQLGLGIAGVIVSIIAMYLSPTFWAIFASMGIISMAP